MEDLNEIKQLLAKGEVDKAISLLTGFVAGHPQTDEAFFLLGNAYRKKENWRLALNSYQSAIEINPNSAAKHAYEMIVDILNFYNKDVHLV